MAVSLIAMRINLFNASMRQGMNDENVRYRFHARNTRLPTLLRACILPGLMWLSGFGPKWQTSRPDHGPRKWSRDRQKNEVIIPTASNTPPGIQHATWTPSPR